MTVTVNAANLVVDSERPSMGGNMRGGDARCWTPSLWQWLTHEYLVLPKTPEESEGRMFNCNVLDVGCGEGQSALWFAAQPGCRVLAIDGLPENIQRLNAANSFGPKLFAVVDDLRRRSADGSVCRYVIPDPQRGYYITVRSNGFALAWCCEVVEHVDEQYLPSLLDRLTYSATLAMTYAPPRQSGHHHVNCRTEDYWVGALAGRGFHLDVMATATARAKASLDGPNKYFAHTGLIFRRNGPCIPC